MVLLFDFILAKNEIRAAQNKTKDSQHNALLRNSLIAHISLSLCLNNSNFFLFFYVAKSRFNGSREERLCFKFEFWLFFFFFFNREIQQTESVKLKKHFDVPLISHLVNKGWLMDWVLEHDSVTRLYVRVFKLQCWPSSPQRCGMSLEIYVIHSWQHSPKVFEGTALHQSWLWPWVESPPRPPYCAFKRQTSRTWINGPVAPVRLKDRK